MYGKPTDAAALGTGGTGALAATGTPALAIIGLVVAALTLIAAGLAVRSLVGVARDRNRKDEEE
ncbi:hypothetical protein DI272_32995 [Streptomyces sp. Act143]|uniref:hypothetical protein n=1 Tax=Streptomyces sp. Act143 TaxID=2200760 RepID=UPI000D6728CC|nr:hypothetical protein [Streptomyces sp. Act143]PWI18424.1 hypothetical protein DI272_32995 [Streptomyces sp. Act143]